MIYYYFFIEHILFKTKNMLKMRFLVFSIHFCRQLMNNVSAADFSSSHIYWYSTTSCVYFAKVLHYQHCVKQMTSKLSKC